MLDTIQGSHAGLRKSYICFSICKALKSLIFGVFPPKRSYKVLFLFEETVSEVRKVVPTLKKCYLNQSMIINYFTHSKFLYLSPSDFVTVEFKLVST